MFTDFLNIHLNILLNIDISGSGTDCHVECMKIKSELSASSKKSGTGFSGWSGLSAVF